MKYSKIIYSLIISSLFFSASFALPKPLENLTVIDSSTAIIQRNFENIEYERRKLSNSVTANNIATEARLATQEATKSFVSADSPTTTLVNKNYTTVVFPVERYDLLGEYNNTTGIFTARESGVYNIASSVLLAQYAGWAVGETAVMVISKNNSGTTGSAWFGFYNEVQANGNLYVGVSASANVWLAAGDTIRIKIYQSSGANNVLDAGNGMYCYLTIKK